MNNNIQGKSAELLWNYLSLNEPLEKADLILVLGTFDTRVAERGTELILQNLAPLIIFSGGFGRLSGKNAVKPEAEIFAKVARKRGVPEEKIIIENKSSNTYENFLFSLKIIKQKKLSVKKIIVVTQPYLQRRAKLGLLKFWPGIKSIFTSPEFTFQTYGNSFLSKNEMLNIMAGEISRIQKYPEKGFIKKGIIPDSILKIYEKLAENGFTKYLVN